MPDDNNSALPAPSNGPGTGAISNPGSMIHGVYRYIRTGFLPCRGCLEAGKCAEYDERGTCDHLARLLDERIRAVEDLPQIDPATDAPLVLAYARELVLQDVILWRMQKTGPVVEGKDGEAQEARLLHSYHDSVIKMLKLATALAITPAKRKELKATGKNLARLMAGDGQ
jgi:hypothetical protein